MEVENKDNWPKTVNDLTEENSSGKTNSGFVKSDVDDVQIVSIQVPTTPVRIRPNSLEDLMDKKNGTETAIIEPAEPENLVVELDPAQLLLGMFDDAPDPFPFEASNNTVFANDSINMNSDGSKRFKGSKAISQDDFVQMVKQYPCLYDKSFLGKMDLETQRLKRNAWQEMANLTGRAVDSLRDRWFAFKKKAQAGNLVYVRLMSMLDDNVSRPYNVSPSKRLRDSTLDDYLLKENNGRPAPAKVHFDNKENIDPKVNNREKHDQFFSDIHKQLNQLPPNKQEKLKMLAMIEIQRIASSLCE